MAATVLFLRAAMVLLALGLDRGAGRGGAGPEAVREPVSPAGLAPPKPASMRRPRWTGPVGAAIPVVAAAASVAAAGAWVARSRLADSMGAALPESAHRGLALVALSLWTVYLLWRVPQWQAAAWEETAGGDPRERWEVENASRATLGQILSGVAVFAGLLFAWQQLGSTTRSVQISEQGQITERFTSAVEQLASDDLSLRLGGIYALEGIAIDSPREFVPSMEVLSAFVREASQAQAGTPRAAAAAPADVSAAMKVIARRSPE